MGFRGPCRTSLLSSLSLHLKPSQLAVAGGSPCRLTGIHRDTLVLSAALPHLRTLARPPVLERTKNEPEMEATPQSIGLLQLPTELLLQVGVGMHREQT